MKVPTLSKYIDKRKGKEITFDKCNAYDDIEDFNEFWKSKPELGHFIPTNKKGEPLAKHKGFNEWIKGNRVTDGIACINYNQSLSRVKWVGWHKGQNGWIVNEFGGSIGVITDSGFVVRIGHEKYITYSSILNVGINLEATEQTAIDLKLK